MKNTDICVVGLDIGTSKVSAVIGKLDTHVPGKINILGVGWQDFKDGVRRGDIVNLEKTSQAVRAAIDMAERHNNINISSVSVGIAGEKIRSCRESASIIIADESRQITTEDVARLHREIYRCPTPQGTQIIHALPIIYRVDEHRDIPDPVGMNGIRLNCEYLIVTASQQSVNNILNTNRNVNLTTNEIILQPLASSYAVLNEEEMQEGVCMIDIGKGTTDIAIFYEGIVQYTAVIPLGSENISEDIKEGCRIALPKAEALKIKYGQAIPPHHDDDSIIDVEGPRDDSKLKKEIRIYTLSQIIMYRVVELAKFALNEIDKSGLRHRINSGIVITGGGSKLKYMADLFEYTTGINTRLGYPTEHLLQGLVDRVSDPSYSTAVGLVVYGLKHSDPTQPSFNEASAKSEARKSSQSEPKKNNSILGQMRKYFEQGSERIFRIDEDNDDK